MNRLLLFSIILFFCACNKRYRITNPADYSGYLQNKFRREKINNTLQEIAFWGNRLKKDTGSYVNLYELARWKLKLFKQTGEIDQLTQGDSLLQLSSEKLNHKNPETLYFLSQNSIAKHNFLQSARYNYMAESVKGDIHTIHLLNFDTWMELGRYEEANAILEQLKDKSSFDYLIRKAKWEDHQGRLDAAIVLMEKALVKVKNGHPELQEWVYSNLGDMYGHAGRIGEAYYSYLNVLQSNPADFNSLKGIAWIVYSADGNTEEAKKILKYILSIHNSPEIMLLLAEIADLEENTGEKNKWLKEFTNKISNPGYGDMYNKYLITIYAEELNNMDKAFLLAKREIDNRFTPETCDWMAWIKYLKDDYKEALALIEKYVYRHTHEPEALIHCGFILAVNGQIAEARKVLEECLQSSFELGPVTTKKVRLKLKTL
jgi:tetratricopeptide (TPR) repeat protein